jgi:hypothetical protein
MFFTAKRAIIIPSIATTLIFLITLYTSCIKNKCNGVVCQHGGVCVDGSCSCIVGYEGAHCETAWSEKFAGKWHADDSYIRDTSHTHFNYDISITGSGPDSFFVSGLSDSFRSVTCYRSSINAFTMKSGQNLDSSITIQNGNGTLNTQNNTITGLYSYRFRGYIRKLFSINPTLLPEPPVAAKNDYIYGWVKTDTVITVNFKWTR